MMISKTKHNKQELSDDEDYQTDQQYKQERFTDDYSEYFEDDENKADRFTAVFCRCSSNNVDVKCTLFVFIPALTKLGFKTIFLVGCDIGVLVAYPYAAEHPTEVKRLVEAKKMVW